VQGKREGSSGREGRAGKEIEERQRRRSRKNRERGRLEYGLVCRNLFLDFLIHRTSENHRIAEDADFWVLSGN